MKSQTANQTKAEKKAPKDDDIRYTNWPPGKGIWSHPVENVRKDHLYNY